MMKTIAQDIMSTEVLTLREGSTIEDALKMLINNRITGIPVVNAANEMVGIVSEYDIMVQVSEMANVEQGSLSVPFRYTKGVESVAPTTPLEEVLVRCIDKRFRRLPVIDKNKLVGIITRRDLMRVFYYRARLK